MPAVASHLGYRHFMMSPLALDTFDDTPPVADLDSDESKLTRRCAGELVFEVSLRFCASPSLRRRIGCDSI